MLSFRVRKAKDGSIVVVEPSEEFLMAFGEAFDTRYGPVPSGIDRFRVDADPASAKKLVESIRIEVTPDDIHDLALRWFLDTRDRNGGAGVVEGLLRDRFHCPDGIGAEVAQEIFTFARSHVEHVCEWPNGAAPGRRTRRRRRPDSSRPHPAGPSDGPASP